LIVPIGSWVLATACAEATHWPLDIKVSVNLSPVQFRRGRELVDVVMTTLGRAGLAARRLDLEVTESVLIEDSSTALSMLEELRAKEIGVSLDDFGTGFASLGYLNDFPFSKIKIDRKFTANIDQSARTSANIGGIATIETENQLERMRSFGISAVQGFLFSRPVPAPELRRLISKPITPGLPPPVRMRGPIYSGVERKAAS
jgi:EAL domain-containing protein (putative c-di-GMP-specific phosphodiesterase class I)